MGGSRRTTLRVLGVDLASQPAHTGACALTVGRRGARAQVWVNLDDEALLDHAKDADATGIDAPFGWPDGFVQLVAAHHSPDRTPGHAARPSWSPQARDALRWRATDLYVRAETGRWPLSVSSDLIAVPAFRCAGLLDRLGVVARDGSDRAWETYPAASLNRWGLRSRGYKGKDRKEVRSTILAALRERTPRLELDEDTVGLCVGTDHALDALVAALTTVAGLRGLTDPPPEPQRELAATEGWIALPFADALAQLL